MSYTDLSECAMDTSNLQQRRWKQAMDVVALFLIILAVHLVIAAFSGKWPWSPNSYNSYLLQTLSWLEGRLDLGQNYEWLELAIFQDKFYVSFPPFPSFVYLPFALIFGEHTPEGWIAFFVMLLGAFYALRMAWHYLGAGAKAVFWSVFLYIGTNVLYVTLDAGVWFIAQNMALTLSLMAIFYAVKGKGGWSLFFWGCSVGCRPLQVLYAPILLYILYQELNKKHPDYYLLAMIKKRFYWAIPVCLVALSYMILNYERFGSPIQFGHDYLPEFTNSEYGQFSVQYIAENIKSLFRLPVKTDSNTLAFYRFNGNCIFLVSPLFVSYFIYLIRKLITRQKIDSFFLIVLPVLVILHMIGLCAHKTMGGFHFGHRYINDTLAYVYLAVMMFAGITETRKSKSNEDLEFLEQADTTTYIETDGDEEIFNDVKTANDAETFNDIGHADDAETLNGIKAANDAETFNDIGHADDAETFNDVRNADDAETLNNIETTSDTKTTTILETVVETETTNPTEITDDTDITEYSESTVIATIAESSNCNKEVTLTADYTYCLHYGLCALGMALNIIGTIATDMGWIS